MKRKIVFLLIAFALLANISDAQKTIASYTISQFAGEEYHNDLSVNIQYASNEDKIYMDVDARKIGKFIILKKDDRSKLLEILNKTLEWKTKADSLHAVFEKEAGSIGVAGGFMYGDKYRFDFSNNIVMKFEGLLNEDGSYKTLMFMSIPKMVASDNEYMDCDSHIIFFDETGIRQLIAGLTTAIDEFIKKEQQNKNISTQFD